MSSEDEQKLLKVTVKDPYPNNSALPLWRKLCFAVGGMPYQMTTTVIGLFLNLFLLEVAQLKPSYVAVILFTGKAWDAISDPTCGFLVQLTNTRWGKMRPWILFSAPFACAAYFFLFFVPGDYRASGEDTEMSMEEKLAYYLIVFSTFTGLLSGLHVPYTALTMYVTNDQKERDNLTAFRMCLEAVGVLAAVTIQGQLVQDTRCNNEQVNSTQTVDDLRAQEWSYRIGALILVAIYLLCSITVFFGVQEKEPTGARDKETAGFWAGVKLVFTYSPYVKASLIFLFLSLAIGIVQGNVALYCTYSLKLSEYFSIFILVMLSFSIIAMPVWQLLAGRFGKKNIYAAGMIILLPALFSLLYIPEKNIVVVTIVMVFSGLGVSVALLMPWSVLPDVLDLFMLEKKTRHDALFYAFYVFFNKLAIGLALGVSQVALSLGGYVTGQCQQADSVADTLRLLITPAPIICILIALICLYFYPIDEQRRQQIKQDLLLYQERTKSAMKDSQASFSYESMSVSTPPSLTHDTITRL